MLAKAHRFHGYGSLRAAYRSGQNYRGKSMGLKTVRRPPGKPYRVAVVVSRKVSKSAVVRNKIRRRLYEAVRRSAETIEPGTDLIFTVFDEKLASVEADKLEASVKELLQKASAQK